MDEERESGLRPLARDLARLGFSVGALGVLALGLIVWNVALVNGARRGQQRDVQLGRQVEQVASRMQAATSRADALARRVAALEDLDRRLERRDASRATAALKGEVAGLEQRVAGDDAALAAVQAAGRQGADRERAALADSLGEIRHGVAAQVSRLQAGERSIELRLGALDDAIYAADGHSR
jgi:hypothetical protein